MRQIIILSLLILSVAGCDVLPNSNQTQSTATSVFTNQNTLEPEEATELPPAPTAMPTLTAMPAPFDSMPTSRATLPASGSIEEARVATVAELANMAPPLRDEIALAAAFLGIDPIVATPQPVVEFKAGTIDNFFISNNDSNTVTSIEAELMSVGDNAYFWFDRSDDSIRPAADTLAVATDAFDDIYTSLYDYFGVSMPAGGRVHIVHASPSVLCDDPDQCPLAGYFSSRDLLPVTIDSQSNEREMFVMNSSYFGTDTYLDTLAHELRHLLGNSYDLGEEDWFIEGAAMLSEDLAGFTMLPQFRGNQFLIDPDLQLNNWAESNKGPHYGKGYLINRFLYDRLGADLYREYSLSPIAGLSAVDEIAAANELEFSGEGLWLDWLVSIALNDLTDTPEQYRWDGPPLEPVATTVIDTFPFVSENTVNQFAADYYELPEIGEVVIDFSGEPLVFLLDSDAPSGESFWYAQRANTSNPRLTRVVDLREVTEAKLQYKVYADIELGYDFAYLSVSTDAGQTWQPLVADGMQGLDPADDPSNSSLTERFYTGHNARWIMESVDLSPFAGQEILLRFEYVTDLMLTYGGFAIDDIVIDEIGFMDDSETLDPGWVAEGFTRATADLPQSWWLQLISFDVDGRPSVERLVVPEDGRFQFTFQASTGERRPLLIIAADTPETLQPASYQLIVNLK